jgi:hypothetical protein
MNYHKEAKDLLERGELLKAREMWERVIEEAR